MDTRAKAVWGHENLADLSVSILGLGLVLYGDATATLGMSLLAFNLGRVIGGARRH